MLLDFDGPVCSLFAKVSASSVAGELQALIAAQLGLRAVEPSEAAIEKDPLMVLRRSRAAGIDAHAVDKVLRAAEVRAARSAAPTPGARAFLAACKRADRSIAIVSNNSAEAVRVYLAREDLLQYAAHIVGRDAHDPSRMKPDPYLVQLALEITGTEAERAVLVGDSPSDVVAAKAAGVQAIGYANKPGKADRLAAAGAKAIVTSMGQLAEAQDRARLQSGSSWVSGSRP